MKLYKALKFLRPSHFLLLADIAGIAFLYSVDWKIAVGVALLQFSGGAQTTIRDKELVAKLQLLAESLLLTNNALKLMCNAADQQPGIFIMESESDNPDNPTVN